MLTSEFNDYQGVRNIRDFGATQDSTNDDGPAINAAIQDLKADVFFTGGRIDIPPPPTGGKTIVSETIQMDGSGIFLNSYGHGDNTGLRFVPDVATTTQYELNQYVMINFEKRRGSFSQRYSATCDAGGSSTLLVDSSQNFASGAVVQIGDIIWNTTDGSVSAVTDVTNAASGQLGTKALVGGSDNTWSSGDTYVINAPTSLRHCGMNHVDILCTDTALDKCTIRIWDAGELFFEKVTIDAMWGMSSTCVRHYGREAIVWDTCEFRGTIPYWADMLYNINPIGANSWDHPDFRSCRFFAPNPRNATANPANMLMVNKSGGDAYPASDTADSGSTATLLVSASAFDSQYVYPGMMVRNTTKNAWAIVESVDSAGQVTHTPLINGANGEADGITHANGDSFIVTWPSANLFIRDGCNYFNMNMGGSGVAHGGDFMMFDFQRNTVSSNKNVMTNNMRWEQPGDGGEQAGSASPSWMYGRYQYYIDYGDGGDLNLDSFRVMNSTQALSSAGNPADGMGGFYLRNIERVHIDDILSWQGAADAVDHPIGPDINAEDVQVLYWEVARWGKPNPRARVVSSDLLLIQSSPIISGDQLPAFALYTNQNSGTSDLTGQKPAGFFSTSDWAWGGDMTNASTLTLPLNAAEGVDICLLDIACSALNPANGASAAAQYMLTQNNSGRNGVTKIYGTSNTADEDLASRLCVYCDQSGLVGPVYVKNNLGATMRVVMRATYLRSTSL